MGFVRCRVCRKAIRELSGEGFKFGGWYRQRTGGHLQEKYGSVICPACGHRSPVCTPIYLPSPQHQAKLTFSLFPLLAPVEASVSLLGIPVPPFARCQDRWCPLISRGDSVLLLPFKWLPSRTVHRCSLSLPLSPQTLGTSHTLDCLFGWEQRVLTVDITVFSTGLGTQHVFNKFVG